MVAAGPGTLIMAPAPATAARMVILAMVRVFHSTLCSLGYCRV